MKGFQRKSVTFRANVDNNNNFILRVHEFDTSNSNVKRGIFTEDSIEVDCFKTMLPDHIVDVVTRGTNR
jgi:hypothetical protein